MVLENIYFKTFLVDGVKVELINEHTIVQLQHNADIVFALISYNFRNENDKSNRCLYKISLRLKIQIELAS